MIERKHETRKQMKISSCDVNVIWWFVIETVLVYTHWTQIILKSAQIRQRNIQPERRWISDLQPYDHHSLKNTRIFEKISLYLYNHDDFCLNVRHFKVFLYSVKIKMILINTCLKYLFTINFIMEIFSSKFIYLFSVSVQLLVQRRSVK